VSLDQGAASGAGLSGKRVVVTGGARGIGEAIARRAGAAGARVGVLDRLTEEGRCVADGIGGVFGEVDLADPTTTRRALTTLITHLGGVDVLVNNAGILRQAPLLETTTDEWDEVFAVNTRALLVTSQVAARQMIAAGAGGRIINIASMAGKTGGAGQAHYAASKAAVIALTRVAALELGPHQITVNALCPGYVLTPMGAATRTDEDVRAWTALSPLGRLATPADVAGVAVFLAGDDGGYLTGQAINVTGGMVMH
jgi:3-oxoacyl-[acyl-carrier protein] reductase